MKVIEIILIGLALGMDAFAIAVCKGLSMKKMNWKKAVIIGIYFGGFQAVMPVIGYLLGRRFESIVVSIDHWIAFILLSFIGIKMIREAFKKEDEKSNESVDFKTMISLAIATSIDALAVGITFSFLHVDMISAAGIVGIIAFLLSMIGVKIGNIFGHKYKKRAEIFGGVILILIGIKVLLEHFFGI